MKILNNYTLTERAFFDFIVNLFKERLIFYCVTGSTARIQNVDDWSDIDIVMVYDRLSVTDLEEIYKVINKNSSSIKIGITCYSVTDIENQLIDPKTFNMVRNISSGKYTPKIDTLNFVKLLNASDDYIIHVNKIEFTKDMHVFRREIMKGYSCDERKLYKTLTYLVRVLIFNTGNLVDGYFETWEKAKQLGWLPEFKILLPNDIVTNKVTIEERFKVYTKWYEFIELEGIRFLK